MAEQNSQNIDNVSAELSSNGSANANVSSNGDNSRPFNYYAAPNEENKSSCRKFSFGHSNSINKKTALGMLIMFVDEKELFTMTPAKYSHCLKEIHNAKVNQYRNVIIPINTYTPSTLNSDESFTKFVTVSFEYGSNIWDNTFFKDNKQNSKETFLHCNQEFPFIDKNNIKQYSRVLLCESTHRLMNSNKMVTIEQKGMYITYEKFINLSNFLYSSNLTVNSSQILDSSRFDGV